MFTLAFTFPLAASIWCSGAAFKRLPLSRPAIRLGNCYTQYSGGLPGHRSTLSEDQQGEPHSTYPPWEKNLPVIYLAFGKYSVMVQVFNCHLAGESRTRGVLPRTNDIGRESEEA